MEIELFHPKVSAPRRFAIVASTSVCSFVTYAASVAVLHEPTLPLDVIGGAFAGVGYLIHDIDTGTFEWGLSFGVDHSVSFGFRCHQALVEYLNLPDVVVAGNRYTGPVLFSPDNDIIASILNATANSLLQPHRSAVLSKFYATMDLGEVPSSACITADYLAGWAIAAGSIALRRGCLSPTLHITVPLRQLPAELGKALMAAVPGSRYAVSPTGADAVFSLIYDKVVLTLVLLRMAQCYAAPDSYVGMSAILAYILLDIRPILWNGRQTHYSPDQLYLLRGIAFLLAHCHWYYMTDFAGGLPAVQTLPLPHPKTRHYRDFRVHRRIRFHFIELRFMWKDATDIKMFLQLVEEHCRKHNMDQWH